MKKLDPSALSIYRLRTSIGYGILWLIIIIVMVVLMFWLDIDIHRYVYYGLCGLLVITLYHILIQTYLSYKYYSYQINHDEITIERGFLFKRVEHIPMNRIYNVDYNVGIIMKRYRVKALSISTAAGLHAIPIVRSEEATEIRKFIKSKMVK